MKNILVYCGASVGFDEIYKNTAIAAGKLLVEKNKTLVYGAGSVGIMGIIADAVLENGGEVVGVIPSFMEKFEVQHKGLTQIHVVETMHQRKQLMAEISDAVVALPGGWGTLDELFEILTWKQLGLHQMPIGLLNVNGFYDPLIEMIHKMVKEGFLKQSNFDMLMIDDNLESLLNRMEQAEYPDFPVGKWVNKA
ncbi:LOG family protein [Flectobacillus longus]|uniref:Cytokinin riboside 5'-monophosphate phosphoribohydrolase n=1 Tax=Flectobacillus longus TaxID=2984207 RepID=A0ABT6YUX2_9BACT|nr:TIGR00730 family Rossman fold protein [Flectobacillus longus]MDI9867345.1 TIGR00730 family Rossman fold protein [Flectobacillus longus]MDI9879028.1 TIGR00730 family Rossman fold protein [Flectobacillus longus]